MAHGGRTGKKTSNCDGQIAVRRTRRLTETAKLHNKCPKTPMGEALERCPSNGRKLQQSPANEWPSLAQRWNRCQQILVHIGYRVGPNLTIRWPTSNGLGGGCPEITLNVRPMDSFESCDGVYFRT